MILHYSIEKGQSLILVKLHDFTLARAFVINSAQMEQTVRYDTMKLTIGRDSKFQGIAGHGVKRDENLAVEFRATAIVKRDNVGVIIVMDKLTVHVEDTPVITKHV